MNHQRKPLNRELSIICMQCPALTGKKSCHFSAVFQQVQPMLRISCIIISFWLNLQLYDTLSYIMAIFITTLSPFFIAITDLITI